VALQVVRYNRTMDRHGYHSDAGPTKRRWLTALLYLSDQPAAGGGHTLFPSAGPASASPSSASFDTLCAEAMAGGGTAAGEDWRAVAPAAGKLLLWYNYAADGGLEPAARHGGCPLAGRGDTKWVANLWLWLRDDVLQLLLRDPAAGSG
jgi:hypothetical protein